MITIFGASVTQQKKGYAAKLKSEFREKMHVFPYGGMHLNNAGICFIDEVLEVDPSYCFVDWFSTSYMDVSDETIEYLDTIIHKFSQKKCKLIFLFLPSTNHNERINFFEFCKNHLERNNIYYIDLNDEIKDLSGILRDSVHTTDFGSHKYCEIIFRKFIDNRNDISIPAITNFTKYIDIKSLDINRTFNKYIELEGSAEIIGFLLSIGPHSGIVEIISNGSKSKVNTWDPYCHYQRMQIDLALIIEGRIRINVLQDDFDTSSCRRDYDFSDIEKKLIIHEIYYIGDALKISNLSSGKKNHSFDLLDGKVSRLIDKYRKFINQ